MNYALASLVLVGSASSIALALRSGFVWKVAVDTPNSRSLHSRRTPRVGGVFFLPWVLAATAAVGGAGLATGLALALAVVSFIDDRNGLPVVPRLMVHLAAAATFGAAVAGWNLPLLVALILAVTWMTNLYNFMDGADGLAGEMAVMGFGVYCVAAQAAGQSVLANSCLFAAAGAAGFLIFNFPPAKTFMGDTGSIPLGFLAAAFGVEGWHLDVWPWWFPLLVFAPFVADASLTLLYRLLRGKPFWQAHRDHAYQKLVRMGWSHRRVALFELALMVAGALSALVVLDAGADEQWWVVGSWGVGYLYLFFLIERRWARVP